MPRKVLRNVIIMGTGANNVIVDVHVKWLIALPGEYTVMCCKRTMLENGNV